MRTEPEQPVPAAGLAALLGHHDSGEFFRAYWEQQPLLAKGAAKHLLDALLTLDQFESLLQCSSRDLTVVDNGSTRPLIDDRTARTTRATLKHVYSAYTSGATLLRSGLHVEWPPIANICRDIELDLLGRGVLPARPVSANAYLTPPSSQGFDIHYDDHCVLVVQLHGAKQWQVFNGETELPVDNSSAPLSPSRLGEPLMAPSLTESDVLYIPRGFPHAATTAASSSLHLTLGIRTIQWADAVADMLRADVAFRRSVPPVDVSSIPPRLPTLDVAAYLQRRRAQCIAALAPLPQGRFGSLDAMGRITAETVVHRLPRVICLSTVDEGFACLTFPGATLRLHRLMQPVFDFVATSTSFRPADLPAVDAEYDAVEFARLLVLGGLFHP
jgi:hypothetical protein